VGLKTDIYDALEKNIGKEHIKNSPEGKAKVDTLADDLSKAIRDFILAQTFRVDKLNASGGPVSVSPAPLMSTPAAVGAPVFTTVPPIPMITVEVDKDGQATGNPTGGGTQSNFSEVRLRKNEVNPESMK
jgi:hypothetical protein